MAVHYEWDVEEQAARATAQVEAGEVLEHWHSATYSEAAQHAASEPAPDVVHVVVLVRDDDNCRAWAYMEDGKLPEYFEDAYGQPHAKVPKRFHAEVARAGEAS